jgi:hypothetical protein
MHIIQPDGESNQAPEPPRPTKKERQGADPAYRELLELLESAQCEFWCTPEREGYATVLVDDLSDGDLISPTQHKENLRLDSEQFRIYLSSLYYDKYHNNKNSRRQNR